ncbi:MAG: hypothetical protein Q8N44_18495 [Rubrivivax sp.]|nr:hypothetical protein [Rubrivivax sp.]MDP3085661.1 hypothetical protein [Rubrivivax sp.]
MSAGSPDQRQAAGPLLLAHEVVQLAALLPGPDNSHRRALQEVHRAIVPWRLGRAAEADVRVEVAALSSAAFMHELDLGRPECWMLGLVSALLGAGVGIDLPASRDGPSRAATGDLAEVVARQLVHTFAEVARTAPTALPLGVSPKLYRVVGGDVARRIEAAAAVAIRKTFGTKERPQ